MITLNDIVVESVDTSKTGSYKITDSTSSNGKTATTNYMIHPVFTFGFQELTGIWVEKI